MPRVLLTRLRRFGFCSGAGRNTQAVCAIRNPRNTVAVTSKTEEAISLSAQGHRPAGAYTTIGT